MNQQFRNIVYLSDRSGTGKWRKIWPIQAIDCTAQSTGIQADYSQTPIIEQSYYKGMTSVTVQRWISTQQRNMFCKFLKPIMDANCGWLLYEIDDNMSDKHIPHFNRGKKAFEPPEVQAQIKEMLNAADFVTVTTDYIKQFYHDEYGVPLENIIAVPNLLPRYLFGDRYRPQLKLDQFKRFKSKPRIGIVSSLSHYNVDGVREDANGNAVRKVKRPDGSEVWHNEKNEEVNFNDTKEITDDIDEIIECIKQTVNDVQWVFFGFVPPKLQDLVKTGKIECHGGTSIMTYASAFDNLQLQAVVAPIKDMEFNRCKSFIKYMECAALGVPLFASNYLPYNRVMPKDQLFSSGNELKEKILKLKFMSNGLYEKLLKQQWDWLNSPCKEGDFALKNFWLEDNLNIHMGLFKLRQKTMKISMNSFVTQFETRQKKEKESTIFKNDNILITK